MRSCSDSLKTGLCLSNWPYQHIIIGNVFVSCNNSHSCSVMVDSGAVVFLGSSWLDNPSCSLLRLPNQFYEPFLITIIMDVYIQIWSNLSQIIIILLYTLAITVVPVHVRQPLHAWTDHCSSINCYIEKCSCFLLA